MFKIMAIPNVEKFFSVVRQSRGDVFLLLPDGTQCDLKKDNTAIQMIRTMQPGREGLRIILSDSTDAPGFILYLMGTARTKAA